MSNHLIKLSIILCLAASSMLSAADQQLEWDKFTFTFTVKEKDKEKEATFTVQVPKKETATPIRGVIQPKKEFMEVAHKHNLALISKYDKGSTRGPSEEFLAAAAKACERPELAFAGAVVIGCSKGGREAAQWAGFHPERTLAVFLDHSFANAPHDKPAYDYMNLPVVPGVPMCFSATKDNTYQNADRREMHYRWCTTAFRDYKQPCTTSIYYESSGHCKVLSRELQAVWLDEVLTLRVPAVVPADKKYTLVPVTIKTGGLVKADLPKKEEHVTYHDNIIIGPANRITKYKEMNFWVPGPKTAALYLEWVKKNGGTIKIDKAEEIAEPLAAKK